MAKSKLQKKKDREKEVRKKILKKREALRAKAREESEEEKKQREVQRIANRLDGKTYINRDAAEQHELIQKNIDILQALEDQRKFEEEQAKNVEVPKSKRAKASADVVFIPKLDIPA